MKYRRYLYLVLATVAMLMAGIMYNFTVFSESIAETFGIEQSTVSLVFSLSQISFFLGGLVFGFLYNYVNFNIACVITSLTMTLGMFLTSRTTALWQVFLTYSILMNFSAGAIYKGVLAAVVPWFTDNLGVATGIMMMGSGLTAFVFNVPMSNLISATDWCTAMMILSGITLLLTLVPALLIRVKEHKKPVKKEKKETVSNIANGEYTTKEMMATKEFYVFFVWTVLLLAGCTSITGNSMGLSRNIGLETAKAASISTIISISNAISRIVYGEIYDKKGRRMAMGITTGFFVIGTVCLHVALLTRALPILVIAFIAIGFSFGGVPTIASTFVLRTFGRENYASNFGIQGSYSLFSPLFGTTMYSMLYKLTSNYQLSYIQLLAYALIAVVMFAVLNKILTGKEKTR